MVRRVPSKQRNARVTRERDRAVFLRLGLLLLCGLSLASGFVYAGIQHFAALKLGYETQDLRKIRDRVAEEQRRFLLDRESAASPARLGRAARQLGMQPMQAAQLDPLKITVDVSSEKTSTAATATPELPPKNAPVKVVRQPKPPTQPNSQQAKLIPARVR